jgi:hypothetical protein
MKIASLIARYLLGLLFLVFGLNGFFHFIPIAPPPGLGGQFMGAVFLSGFISSSSWCRPSPAPCC